MLLAVVVFGMNTSHGTTPLYSRVPKPVSASIWLGMSACKLRLARMRYATRLIVPEVHVADRVSDPPDALVIAR